MSRVISTEELIRTFHQKIIKIYPELTSETVNKICRAEFIAMKQSMTSGSLEDFRLQYLFNIRVSPQRIIKQLTYMHNAKETIKPKDYNHYMTMMLNHVRDNINNDKFKKYYERIRELTGYTREQISEGQYIDNGLD